MLREDEHAYRERMEAFVSGLTGTTMAELVLVSIPIPMGIWLLGELKVRLVQNADVSTGKKIIEEHAVLWHVHKGAQLTIPMHLCEYETGAPSWTEEDNAQDGLAFFRLGNARCSVSSGSLNGLAAANGYPRAVHGHHK